jgi:serine/threonine-protein kinase
MTDVAQDDQDLALRALVSGTGTGMSERLRGSVREVAERHFRPLPGDAGDLVAEGTVLGSYAIDGVLGAGGQAVVYLGRHVRLPGRLVAVKVPHGERTRSMLSEAEVLARLDHPGILKLVDIDAGAVPPYVVFDFCSGGSLADRLAAEGPLPEAEVARIARELLLALEYAHGRDVVHRDLKPGNVLFDGSGHARIGDFGIGKIVAEHLQASLTHVSVTGVAGTPVYMAPEQERAGAKVDGRTDLYALGKLIYQMLTGVVPRTLRPVEQARTGVRAGWSELVFKLTADDPERRFPDARSVLVELDRLMSPKVAAPTSPEAPPAPWRATSAMDVVRNVIFVASFLFSLAGTVCLVNDWSPALSLFVVSGFLFFFWLLVHPDNQKHPDQEKD